MALCGRHFEHFLNKNVKKKKEIHWHWCLLKTKTSTLTFEKALLEKVCVVEMTDLFHSKCCSTPTPSL